MASSVNNGYIRKKPRNGGKLCWFFNIWWRILQWLPVILVVAIMSWSYYAYAIELCFMTIQNVPERILYLTVYHVLLVMFFWSYWQTILTQSNPVPDSFKIPQSEMDRLINAESEEEQRMVLDNFARNLPIVTRTASGCIRYCNRCAQVKPDRAHHCSVCQSCILKMDHHCPWVNNCVHYHNYKFFVLFLFYALFYCLFIAATDFRYFIEFWRNPGMEVGVARYHVIFVFLVALMFGLTLGSLFGYHTYLTIRNRTTLEAFRAPVFTSGPDKNGFSLGSYRNFKQVFGERIAVWFLPIFSSAGAGVQFPSPSHARSSSPRTSYRALEASDRTRPAQHVLRQNEERNGVQPKSSSESDDDEPKMV